MTGEQPLEQITGVVLAGGRGRRMGGQDKGLVKIDGRATISYVVAALRPQVGAVLVNANRNRAEYRRLCGCAVVADRVGDFAGPLAGMASALEAADTELVLAAPCDSPFVAPDLARRLHGALQDARAELSVAHDGQRLQPVFALLGRALLPSLLAFLDAGERKIDLWYARHRMATADFSDRPELFLNANTPQQRAALEQRMRADATDPSAAAPASASQPTQA